MRQRSIVPSLFVASVAAITGVACGGVPFGSASDGGGTPGEDAEAETGTVTIGPPDSSTPPEDATTTEHPDATSDAAGDTSAEASPGSDGATDHDATSADAAEPIDSAPPEDSAAGCPIATPTLCGTTCVDEATDPSHCGGCSTVCSGAGANATNQCISSKCEIVCDSGYQQCTVSGTTTCVAPSTTQGVFVSTSSSATTGCGSISAPCGTIAAGIAIAKAQGLTIMYLDAGTYAEEVSLIDGLTIEGGWLYKGAGVWDVECGGTTNPSTLAIIQPFDRRERSRGERPGERRDRDLEHAHGEEPRDRCPEPVAVRHLRVERREAAQ